MAIMDGEDVIIEDLIAQGEHENQDFKFRVDEPAKIAKTLCAFANTSGGRLLIGVKDNGAIKGIDPEEEYYIIEAAAQRFCKPEVSFSYKVWYAGKDKDKLVLEIIVNESHLKPHKALSTDQIWTPYIRIKDDTLAANRITVGVWKRNLNPIKKPEILTDKQLDLLRIIHQNKSCSISSLYREVKMPRNLVDKLLILFISWNLVDQKISKDHVIYSCNDPEFVL